MKPKRVAKKMLIVDLAHLFTYMQIEYWNKN